MPADIIRLKTCILRAVGPSILTAIIGSPCDTLSPLLPCGVEGLDLGPTPPRVGSPPLVVQSPPDRASKECCGRGGGARGPTKAPIPGGREGYGLSSEVHSAPLCGSYNFTTISPILTASVDIITLGLSLLSDFPKYRLSAISERFARILVCCLPKSSPTSRFGIRPVSTCRPVRPVS